MNYNWCNLAESDSMLYVGYNHLVITLFK